LAYAIDSPWSDDRDDAVSVEVIKDGVILYVHVADPSSSVTGDSAVERESRDRGATLYIPEGPVRMMDVSFFAISPDGVSPTLTFKITLDTRGNIKDTEIFQSLIKAQCLTYEKADSLLDAGDEALCALYRLTRKNFIRRENNGAINIEMPEVRISLEQGVSNLPGEHDSPGELCSPGTPVILPVVRYRSTDIVKECMLLAGEAAGKWAIKNSLPFPFLGQQVELQETGRDLFPARIIQSPPAAQATPDFAMSWQLRRSMRQRVISVKPEWHEGLGLEVYSQVTSPLRRYADLLAHIQISAVIRNREILSAQELSLRLAAGEAAYQAVVQAERASKKHWTMVYLYDKKDSPWNAVALGKSGSLWNIVIPSLALETQVNLGGKTAPNDKIMVILKSVNVPQASAIFAGE
jgi:exoribonuclease-2